MGDIPSAILGDMGVALSRFTFGKLGFIFREKPTLDYGIDGEIELVENGRATGRLVVAQIKCGQSYFAEATDTHIVYRFSEDHFRYWSDHSLPVIVILVDYELEVCYWAKVDSEVAIQTGKNFKLAVPKSQTLDEAAVEAITAIATPLIDQERFECSARSTEDFGAVRLINMTVTLSDPTAKWSKADVEQVVRQATAGARTRQILESREQRTLATDRQEIHLTVLAAGPEGTQTIVARIEITRDGNIPSLSNFWEWRSDWNEKFFQNAITEKVSREAERYIARMAGPQMTAFIFLDWLEARGRGFGGGYQGGWLASRLTSLIEEFADLGKISLPLECATWHQHLTDMVRCMSECRDLAASEGEWNGKIPAFYKHRSAGNALIEEALQHSCKANEELQRLSKLVFI